MYIERTDPIAIPKTSINEKIFFFLFVFLLNLILRTADFAFSFLFYLLGILQCIFIYYIHKYIQGVV